MFSKHHRTFTGWLATQSGETPYVLKIKRLHALHPQAKLAQLRRHQSRYARPLGGLKRTPPALISPRLMTPRERRLQQDAIDVAAEMRRTGEPLTTVSKRLGVNRAAVSRRLSPYLQKRHGRLTLSETDRLPRAMLLYDDRGAYTVVVRSRREASKIGRYHAALFKWRRSFPRDNRILAPFRRMVVTDENGAKHHFLTDPIALDRLFASREIRFESVYHYVS
jgi:hypothetical protein